jgi:mannose-6-phosphate isomerase-like protein (cupin superfamily)
VKTGDRIEKPWGWEQILELNDRYCIKHLFVASGHRLSKQYHERKMETQILVSGVINLSLWDGDEERVVSMVPSQPYHLVPGTVHRIAGGAPDGGLILEVSTTELEDVVRLEDDYGR